MTEEQDKQTKLAKDWRKQGLGWVPDYPDARDYTLDREEVQKDGRLRRDEVTTAIEDLAETVTDLLETLSEDAKTKKSRYSKEKLKELQSSLNQKVFGEVVFNKIKVYKILRKGSPESEDIVQLKYYLNLLKDCQGLGEFKQKLLSNFQNEKYWLWIRRKDFDETTEKIVKYFQAVVNIRVDGIVGLETYSAIREYLLDPNKQIEEDSNLSRIELVSVPSLIPHEILKIILEKLIVWWEEFEHQSFTNSFAVIDKNDPNKFSEIFNREFSVVEPLVSAIIKSICPLARYDSLTRAVEEGLNNFHDVILNKGQTNPRNNLDRISAQKSIQKSKRLIDYEKERFTEDIDKQIREFYDFFDNIVQGYMREGNISSSDEPSFWDKGYLIEIGKSQEETQQPTFFTPFELHLPMNRSLYTKNKSLNLYNKNTYPKLYFFLQSVIDLSFWCSSVEDQGSLNSCAAFAGTALLEYFARKRFGQYTHVSPLFLYKAARNLMQSMGDTGASVRETMRAMAAFGVPPEKYWTYEEEKFDEEPPAFCYSYAQNYQTLKYFRLDYGSIPTDILLFRVKAVLAAGFPCMFGFTVYRSIYKQENITKGQIPFPTERDEVVGGHVVVAVGYDDYKEIEDADGKQHLGALLIRNSWGAQWGQGGYGWLPYEYVLKGLTADWWSLLKAEWFEAGNFGLGAYDPGNPGGNIGRP